MGNALQIIVPGPEPRLGRRPAHLAASWAAAIVAFLAGSVVVTGSARAQDTWTITDLGTLGGNYSQANGIDGDIVVGIAQLGPEDGSRAFAYDLATGGPMVNLGVLGEPGPGFAPNSEALAVDGDIVVGNSSTSLQFQTHAFAYDLSTDGPMLDLGTLGGTTATATDVAGQVVAGWSFTATGEQHAFAFDLAGGGPMVDLGILDGTERSLALEVVGTTVVGVSTTIDLSIERLFSYDLATDGPMIDLGALPDGFDARDSNGALVAGSRSGADNRAEATVHDWVTGSTTPLGFLDGFENSYAVATDGILVVGGGAGQVDSDGGHAFAYDLGSDGPIVDLGTLPGGERYSIALAAAGDRVVGLSITPETPAGGEAGYSELHAVVWERAGALAPQEVSWSPSTDLVTSDSPWTPDVLAIGDGGGVVSYEIADAGSTECTVDSATAVMSFTGAGICVVRASAAATEEAQSGSMTVAFTVSFPDVLPGAAFYEDIMWLATEGIAEGGVGPGGARIYGPADSITREAMAAFLYRFAGEPAFTPPAVSPFTDLSPGDAFYAEITWLAAEGIEPGGSEFRPTDAVTRREQAVWIFRALTTEEQAAAYMPTGTEPFADVDPAHPAYTEISWMWDSGLSTGANIAGQVVYAPDDEISREAMAAFFHRAQSLLQ